MPRWARISVWFVIGLVAVGTYVYLFGTQNALALMWRYKCRGIPEAYKTPVPLKDVSVSSVPHTKLSYCGYEFELPWSDVDAQKSRSSGPIRVTAFRSGNAFWFSCFPPKSFVSEFMKGTRLDSDNFTRLYGAKAFESDYAFYGVMLAVTPERITPFSSRIQAVRDSELLLTKVMAMPNAGSGLFLIQTARFKGFQFGDPAAHPPRISDELYADDGGTDLIFLQNKSAPAISQPEINRVLRSVRKISNLSR